MDSWKQIAELWQEKVQSLKENIGHIEILAAGFLVLVILAGGFLLFWRGRPSSAPQVKEVQKEKRIAVLTVHVAGAVVCPGVYQLKEGNRVVDAVKAAGNALPEGDLDAINLAAKLVDGQKIYIPRKGEVVVSSTGSISSTEQLIPLNLATKEQLQELPGVGEVLADRIVQWREAHGRFSKIDQLLEIEGIGTKKFEQLKDRVSLD